MASLSLFFFLFNSFRRKAATESRSVARHGPGADSAVVVSVAEVTGGGARAGQGFLLRKKGRKVGGAWELNLLPRKEERKDFLLITRKTRREGGRFKAESNFRGLNTKYLH